LVEIGSHQVLVVEEAFVRQDVKAGHWGLEFWSFGLVLKKSTLMTWIGRVSVGSLKTFQLMKQSVHH
jgi:hypothetical protein